MHRLLVALLCVGLLSCSSVVDRPYQTVALSRGLTHDGFLVGIEKRARKDVQYCFPRHDESRLRMVPTDPRVDPNDHRTKVFERVHADRRILFVSHVYEMGRLDADTTYSRTIYNAYEGGNSPSTGVFRLEALNYEMGYGSFDRLAKALEKQVVRKDATHVLVLCMGWHNDQIECLARYNAIVANLKRVGGPGFRPVSVCVTWPSAWLQGSPAAPIEGIGHIASYPTKADDADELGFGIGNVLLHDVVLPLKARHDVKVVVAGHSLGARAMSRAVASRAHLKCDRGLGQEVDLFMALQGAYSAHRYVQRMGNEGSPYVHMVDHPTRTVLTTSHCDDANPIARWVTGARYVGGKYGLADARKHPCVFDVHTWPDLRGDADALPPVRPGRIVMVDATSIVKDCAPGTTSKPVSAHNDILDTDMAALLWYYMTLLADQP